MSGDDDALDEPSRPPSVAPGSRFGKYEMLRKLGEGGMGAVYEARHVDLDKRVAVKVLRSKLARNRTYLERFLREGRIAAKLDHPHVVDVSDVGTEDGVPFLVMEFLSGRDLAGLLDARGPLEVAEAVDLLLPILSALDAAHAAGLVHRDLKPANIFLCRAPHGGTLPKLLDFGIAKPSAGEKEALTGTAEVFGTPQYMAPEQVRRTRDATASSDQYAMGVVLYRCVVGREAFELGESSMFEVLERVVAGRFPAPRVRRPDLDESVERVILRAMAKAPMDRYPSVLALGAALLPFASPPVRHTWTEAFSTRESMADTIAPSREGPSTAPTVVHARSAPDPASGPASRPRATPPAGTLAAAEVASRPSVRASASPRRRRGLVFLGAAAGIALSATVYLVATRSGPAAGGPSVSSSARAEAGTPSAEVDHAAVSVVAGSATPAPQVPADTASANATGSERPAPPVVTSLASSAGRTPPRLPTSSATAVATASAPAPVTSTHPTPSYTID